MRRQDYPLLAVSLNILVYGHKLVVRKRKSRSRQKFTQKLPQ